MSVNIMIVDDQPLFRDGLKTVLDLEKGIKVIATVSNGKEALLVLNSGTLPDLVLLDIDGLGTIKEIKQTYPQIKKIKITGVIPSVFDVISLSALLRSAGKDLNI